MAVAFSMRLEGGPAFVKALEALPESVRKPTLLKMLRKAAEPLRDRAAAMAPRGAGPRRAGVSARKGAGGLTATSSSGSSKARTGHLADNIVISSAPKIGSTAGGRWQTADINQAAVAIGPSQPYYYGIFLEYGTVKIKTARPFMRPAFDSEAPNSLGIIQEEMWAALRAAAMGRAGGGTGGGGLL